MSLMKTTNNSGPKTLPCGTPLVTYPIEEDVFSIFKFKYDHSDTKRKARETCDQIQT